MLFLVSVCGETCSLSFGWMWCHVNGFLRRNVPCIPRKMSRSGLSFVSWCGIECLAAYARPALVCNFPESCTVLIRFLYWCYCMCLTQGSGGCPAPSAPWDNVWSSGSARLWKRGRIPHKGLWPWRFVGWFLWKLSISFIQICLLTLSVSRASPLVSSVSLRYCPSRPCFTVSVYRGLKAGP